MRVGDCEWVASLSLRWQMLYADIFQSRHEFEQMFPHAGWRKMREKYGAEGAFPDVFDKMHSLY